MPCFLTDVNSIDPDQPITPTFQIHRILSRTVIISFLLFAVKPVMAQNTVYFNPEKDATFFFKAGVGYGIAYNPVYDQSENKIRGGITLNASLGYRFHERFSIGFGPSFWIEGKDVMDNSASNNEVPSNKRTLVTLDGYYQPFQKLPLQIKLGAGIGSMVYTPSQKVVTSDNNGISKTEITNGFAAAAGLIYRIRVAQKLDLYPSLNFNYGKLEPQKIPYSSLINHHQASIVADLRISAFIFF